jgi:hypothetical protein
VAGRIALARWAMTQKEPDLAAQAVASVKQVDPTNAEAAALDKQIAAVRPPPATAPATQPAATGRPPGRRPPGQAGADARRGAARPGPRDAAGPR